VKWRAVPIEPTKEMLEAGVCARCFAAEPAENVRARYRAMLAVAPRPDLTAAEALDRIECLIAEHGDENRPEAQQALALLRRVMGVPDDIDYRRG
jgi:hypothetical protein